MHHQPTEIITLVFSILLLCMILCLAFEEKIHAKKSVITGTFAVFCVLFADIFGILPIGDIHNVFGESIHIPTFITAIDWEVISIIVGTSLFVDVTSKSGLFSWIALKVTKLSKGDPQKLLYYYSVLTVLFSALLSNVTAMVIIGSLTAVSLQKLKRIELLLGFLLIEGFLTNVGGLLTLISSVPNIIIGNLAGISFVEFFIKAAPLVTVASIGSVLLGSKLFGITSIKDERGKEEALKLVLSFDENDTIKSPLFFKLSALSFVFLILLFATASYLPYLNELGLGYIALSFGILSLWVFKHEADRLYAELDWDLIWFFLTLFVVINTMEHAGVLNTIGTGIQSVLSLGPNIGSTGLLWLSAIASSVTDNIPLAAVLGKILSASPEVSGSNSPLWWAVIFGANLGGNISPIGSASTVVAVTIIQKNKLGLSFSGFIKAALPFAFLQLVLATVYMLIFL